ncbi:mannan endo-1,4-beta-mannosidase [Pustulibacterium marinum]|uniref:Mannan endo-1,4-beta-mannosidase n=1 Tax=Pustulibacterium marinum TaxID=1224947 RepID=A0A1I7GFQ0_9FLAO|nr:mannan endo-1,4-beta-mannosidase [Pustulibacterium marinum]
MKIISLKTTYILFISVLFLSSCKSIYTSEYKKPVLVDKNISTPTKYLHKKLFLISKEGFAVSQQDATSYGIGWKYADQQTAMPLKSDVYDVVNDYPAGFGFDIGGIEYAHTHNLDGVAFTDMKTLMVEAYKNGGFVTVSWHLGNPVSGGNSWDTTPAVSDIIEGGAYHETYKLWVKRVADFFKSVTYKNKPIPIIFRPFHEMNGSWFWWGDKNCNTIDYIKLWRETVNLLRDEYNVHNVLYVYSPNKLNATDEYLKYYPADAYVDILGIDIYDFYNTEDFIKSVQHDLNIVKNTAETHNKLFAFTETGLEKLNTAAWFTNTLYPYIKDSGICWILFWRNHTTNHFYMPYKKQALENDLIEFSELPKTLFLKDIQKIKIKK